MNASQSSLWSCQAAGWWPTSSHQRQWSIVWDEQASLLCWSNWTGTGKPYLGSPECCFQCAKSIPTGSIQFVQDFPWKRPGPPGAAPCSCEDRWSKKSQCSFELLAGRLWIKDVWQIFGYHDLYNFNIPYSQFNLIKNLSAIWWIYPIPSFLKDEPLFRPLEAADTAQYLI